MPIAEQVKVIAANAREASTAVARLTSGEKNQLLLSMADALTAASGELIAANAKDLAVGRDKGLSAAMLDRLLLDEQRINGMADALRQVAALPDPVGTVDRMWLR